MIRILIVDHDGIDCKSCWENDETNHSGKYTSGIDHEGHTLDHDGADGTNHNTDWTVIKVNHDAEDADWIDHNLMLAVMIDSICTLVNMTDPNLYPHDPIHAPNYDQSIPLLS